MEKKLIKYLEKKIEGCIELGGMEKEKWVFIQCLKEVRKQVSIEEKKEEVPELVGHLNKEFGYNYFEPIIVGTPVYSFKDKYYFEMINTKSGLKCKQTYYKETLEPCIKFI
jgi:trehalose-6-phosphate synthase